MGQEEAYRDRRKTSETSSIDKWRLIKISIISIAIRLISYACGQNWLSSRPELTSPLVNFRRLQDGVAMLRDGVSPYDGDLVLFQPIILRVFSPFLSLPPALLLVIFCMFDCFTAFLLLRSTLILDVNQNIPWIVFKCYLLNPFTIFSSSIYSISSFYNLITAAFVYFFCSGSFIWTTLSLALLANFGLYPVALIGSVFLRFPSLKNRISTVLILIAGSISFAVLNYILNGFNWNFVQATYVSMLKMDDLNPNSGVFWYFFIQVFPQFRQFYLAVCQFSLLFYIVPLTFAVRKDAHLHMFLSLLLIAIFSTYPTLNYGSVYLALIPTLEKYWKQPVRFVLLLGGMMITCVVLMPVMWHMWIVVGSGNANFYFAVTLLYNFAQIYLMIDLLFAYFRIDLQNVCGDEITLKTTLTFRPLLTNYEKNK